MARGVTSGDAHSGRRRWWSASFAAHRRHT
jgi:hypothetical protein